MLPVVMVRIERLAALPEGEPQPAPLKPKPAPPPAKPKAPSLTDAEKANKLLAEAEQLADIQPAVARLRCKTILRDFANTEAAKQAEQLLETLKRMCFPYP